MAKSERTLQLEKAIWEATIKQGVFGCFEVTIGWFGRERVDYMTYDTNGLFRCYEIKVSVSDFHSKHHNTFVGHLNYYVLTWELWNKVKKEIPAGIGVFVQSNPAEKAYCVKRATRREPTTDVQVLKDSFIRSLFREVEKSWLVHDGEYLNSLKARIDQLERILHRSRQDYLELENEVRELYGTRWRHPEKSQVEGS